MIIPILQIVASVILIVLILLQEREGGVGGIFGGGDTGGVYHTRRGFEKLIFWGTIVLAVLFVVFAVLHLLL